MIKPEFLAVPMLNVKATDSCKGCAFNERGCMGRFEQVFGRSCFSREPRQIPKEFLIAIENTPEAIAAYIAARLEQ